MHASSGAQPKPLGAAICIEAAQGHSDICGNIAQLPAPLEGLWFLLQDSLLELTKEKQRT